MLPIVAGGLVQSEEIRSMSAPKHINLTESLVNFVIGQFVVSILGRILQTEPEDVVGGLV